MSLLEVENVSRHFGSLVAVRDVSMSVADGELRAVIGPNGAGKTTFFNLISGFLAPTSGRILFDEEDITNLLPARRVWRGIARTFQVTEIFPELTVRENLRIAVEVASGYRLRPWISRIAEAEISTRVTDLSDKGGLADREDRPVGELSHGDQRATEIMMALALNPRLLLLDEPTAGMGDQETYDITASDSPTAPGPQALDRADRARYAGRLSPRRPHHGLGRRQRCWPRARHRRSPPTKPVQAAYLGQAA